MIAGPALREQAWQRTKDEIAHPEEIWNRRIISTGFFTIELKRAEAKEASRQAQKRLEIFGSGMTSKEVRLFMGTWAEDGRKG